MFKKNKIDEIFFWIEYWICVVIKIQIVWLIYKIRSIEFDKDFRRMLCNLICDVMLKLCVRTKWKNYC